MSTEPLEWPIIAPAGNSLRLRKHLRGLHSESHPACLFPFFCDPCSPLPHCLPLYTMLCWPKPQNLQMPVLRLTISNSDWLRMLLLPYRRQWRMYLFRRSNFSTKSSAFHLSTVTAAAITRVQTVLSSAHHIRPISHQFDLHKRRADWWPLETEHRGIALRGEAKRTHAHSLWLLSVNTGEAWGMPDEDALGQGAADVIVAGCGGMQMSGVTRRQCRKSERHSWKLFWDILRQNIKPMSESVVLKFFHLIIRTCDVEPWMKVDEKKKKKKIW